MAGIELEPTEIAHTIQIQGSNQSGMRERNERLVLTILRRQGPLAKAEIARRTGLSAQTVSVIMRALEHDGLLEKGDKVRGKVGQPSVPLRLAPEGAYFFGLKVGRRSAELVLVDFVGTIHARRRKTYRYPTPQETLDFVRLSVADILKDQPERTRARLAGLGIASPYFLWEWATVIGVDPGAMAAWKDCDLEAEIGALFDFPVHLGNDATCACGAELVFGTAQAPADFLYVYLGYFIGGGVVLNGNLYTGTSGNAGAIGPFPSRDPSGAPSQLVDVASLMGLERRLSEAGGDPQVMWDAPGAWSVDDAILTDWMAEAVPAITHAIVSAISIIDFPAIIIDGSMPTALRDRVLDAIRAEMMASNLSGLTRPDILAGTIGTDARPLGAASIPLSRRFMLET